MNLGPILFCGDPHSQFRHIIEAAGHTRASAVVMLGDMEPKRPLHIELAPLLAMRVPVYWIPGNHDCDNEQLWLNTWGSELAADNVHGRVVTLPSGHRLAGLAGVFRASVWYPKAGDPNGGVPLFRSRLDLVKATPQQHRLHGGPHVKQWAAIFPDEVDALANEQADILITHEAPGYHGNGFDILDTLAQSMGVKVVVHGHQHDALDSSAHWAKQGFRSYGVGLRGVSAMWPDGHWTVVIKGELDEARSNRQRDSDAFGDSR